jgi:two-component system, sporulation sensor kinase E
LFTGIVVMIGWAFNVPGIENLYPKYVSMRFNTALCFGFIGGALLLTQYRDKKYNNILFTALYALTTLFAGLTLAQNIFNFNAGIDQLFVADNLAVAEKYKFPGRMADNVSLCFVLFGLALLCFSLKNRVVHILGQWFLHLVTAISATAYIGYLYGLPLFYDLSLVGSMAVHTAALFFFISIIAAMLHPNLGVTVLFTGKLVGNKMARRLFLLMALMIIVFGELRIQSLRYHLGSTETEIAILAICFLIAVLILIWYTANWLNKIDIKRYKAEEEIKAMNEELEVRVEERSADLLNLLDKFTESESKFRAAFEHSAIGMALVSLKGEWLKANRRLCEMLGYSEEELLSMTLMDVTYPDDLDISLGTLQKAGTSESSYRIEKRYVCKDGSIVWTSVNMATVTDDTGRTLYVVSQIEDITERKRIDARFRTIVESVFVGIKLNDAGGNIIYRSPSMKAINGWTDEEMNKNYFLLTHPDDLELIKGVHREVLSYPGKSVNVIYRIRHKNGYYIWIESLLCNKLADPELCAIITVTRDITEQKMAEDLLKKSEEKYHSLIEHASDAIYLLDFDGNFTDVNESMCKMTGYSKEELLQLNIEALIDPEQLKTDPLVHGPRNPDKATIRERRFIRKNGEIFDIEANVKMFAGEKILVIARDITERKHADEVILREKTLSETIINSLPEVFYLRSETGEFLRWNKNFEKVTGYTSEEIKELHSGNLPIEQDREEVLKARANRKENGYATLEARVRTKNGAALPFLITVTSIIYENQPCVLGIAIDISLRKKSEEELRSSEHKYKLLFESNPLPMWMVAKDDLSVIAVNEAAATLYGYTKEEIMAMDVTKFRHPDDLREQAEDWNRDVSDSARVIRHVKKDGVVMFVQVIAQDIVFEGREVRLSFTNDITEKIKAEETLKKSEANLKTIMDTTDTAYALMDKELNIMAFNQTALKFAGKFNPHPVNGDKLADYLSSERMPQFLRYAGEVLNGKNISYEINYPQADDSVHWYYVRLFPITNDKNEIFGLMLALSDITERKKAEDSLKAAYAQIQDHINSIKDMAWKQSHLMRSPVANLKGLVSILETNPSDGELLRFITLELNRLDTVIIEMAEDASNHD